MKTQKELKQRNSPKAIYFSILILLVCATLSSRSGDYNITGKPLLVRVTRLLQQQQDTTKSNAVFTAVEVQPEYPGGMQAFNKLLITNLRYPKSARENKIQGKVFVQFIVDKDGSLSNIKSVRDPGYGLGDEAVRVLKLSPKWTPGKQNGKNVRVMYTVPVNFAL